MTTVETLVASEIPSIRMHYTVDPNVDLKAFFFFFNEDTGYHILPKYEPESGYFTFRGKEKLFSFGPN